SAPSFQEIGFGGKYNFAFPWADIDLGLYYHKTMPLRGLVSVKSTIRNTELYSEAVGSIGHETWDDFRFSANIGFLRNFFAERITLNGEVFYNGENDAVWFKPETDLQDADVTPFIKGFNGAVNVLYRPRPGGWKDLRLFAQCLFSFEEHTAYLVPGFSIAPVPHVNIYTAVPLALGSRDGTYYTRNADNQNRPFTIVFLVSVNGSYHFGHYQ
ncbi:MAG: glycoside hydrolase family 76 protein, partial [Treponema sp.]|nr:glycoside hydrolase family 76 protein [Treponema sp.]